MESDPHPVVGTMVGDGHSILKSAIDRPSYRELILERKNLGEDGCGWRNRIK